MKNIDVRKLYEEETQYQFDTEEISLGPWTSYSLINDPKHLAFVLSRYKFCAKMLSGKNSVMEVGCGDGFGLPIIANTVGTLYAIDWDERSLQGTQRRLKHLQNVVYKNVNLNNQKIDSISVDAIYNIDVLEHINPADETVFMQNMVDCLHHKRDGVMIVGTPNKTSSIYATSSSKALHCNLKTMDSLKELMDRYFYNVFLFGMNDEVLHTGYAPMCHYIWAIGAGVKEII